MPLPPSTLGGLVGAVAAVLVMAGAFFMSNQNRTATEERVTHTHNVVEQLEGLFSSLKDAETGQRGFLLTGDEKYLEPYNRASGALDGQITELRRLTSDNPQQQARLAMLEPMLTSKKKELERTVELKRSGENDAALAVVRTDQGKTIMVQLRTVVQAMIDDERALLDVRRVNAADAAAFASAVTVGGSGTILFLIFVTGVLLSRDHRARVREVWLKSGQAVVVEKLQGESSLALLGETVLDLVSGYVDALAGSLYIAEDSGGYKRIAGVALPKSTKTPVIRPGEGLVGRVIASREMLHVTEVPEGYLSITSSVGTSNARELAIVPLVVEEVCVGVMELAFFRKADATDLELLQRLSEPIGFALASSRYRSRLQNMLEESQRQSEELQSQQTELEAQRAELEATNEEMSQTNALMEVQTQELEAQRDALTKAREISDKASRYKSEFLANMSHELRTPLNSSLILARLLADNKEGNLTADQVRSAETIYGAGNDLLDLINDILDLAKIEAGRPDILSERVTVDRLTQNLERAFRPVAKDKKVAFKITRVGEVKELVTDGRRLEQILKNLLSNAFKFTARGEVELTIEPAPDEGMRFAVRDTGIGIPESQQSVIFEAFRQADGTTSRKYGGTGLGLSISRELARILGGELVVSSIEKRGSIFSLVLPLSGPNTERTSSPPEPTPRPAQIGSDPPRSSHRPSPPAFPDDRDKLSRRGRLILAVEDDVEFSRVLHDLAHELDFDCVVAATADDGVLLARELQPNGILLDVGLPDASGLSVLERLKRDPATRHVPIHMISASDDLQTALELGAIGYAVKPVARQELVAAIEKLQDRHSREVRRVLLVEDDVRQQESIRKLLGGEGVELVVAGSVKDALEKLETLVVDCMVLDLTLPDGSGHDLLKTMSEGSRYSFPPVIVYTGRELDRSDEEKLRRYSRSIIVKGARSPERLLDEVTLFLHQVESRLPAAQRSMLADARQREAVFEGRRILVVEDDVRNVFALTKVLESRGAKVDIARNGREALELLDRVQGIHLVLMDLMMPEMDGLTAIREIRKKDALKRLPIIALTAKAMADDRDNAIDAGANDYMAKPFAVDKLVSLCRVWLPR